MKKKLFLLICAGMMMTGCADQGKAGQKEPEVISIDLDGDAQDNEANGEQTNNAGSDVGETVQPGAATESQEQEAEITSEGVIEKIQNKENTQDLYMQFINNEVPVVIANDYLQDDSRIFNLEGGKSYTFAELGQYVDQTYFDPEYSEKTSYDHAQYTYVGCPDSDFRNFLIKFAGLNIYSPDDDSFAVCVITEDNGQLYLTGGYECWARSYTEQYRDGLCVGGGSAGAGDHYSWESVIMSNGKMTDIYEARMLSGWWASYVSGAIYDEVFGGNEEIILNVSIYTIGEEEYYTYDFSECTEDQTALCETYINRCRDEAGIKWVTEEEVEEAVKKRCSAIGIIYDTIDQQEIVEWTNI